MLYLELLHGRKKQEQDMDDWGFNGPVIGPLEHIHMTYLYTFRMFFKTLSAANKCGFEYPEENWIDIQGDMILFQGNYYGDWSMSDLTTAEVAKMRGEKGRINAIPHKKYSKLIADANIAD